MGSSSTTKSNEDWTTTPFFTGQGNELLGSLMGQFGSQPSQSEAGQYLSKFMQPGENPYMQEQVQGIKDQSSRQMGSELAQARSMTRDRPNTFSSQVAGDVIGTRVADRDLQLANLLSGQYNMDRQMGQGAAQTLMGADLGQLGAGTSLLGLLRGETGKGTSRSRTKGSPGFLEVAQGLGSLMRGAGAMMNP